MLGVAAEALHLPNRPHISADLIAARFVKPLDEELIAYSASRTGKILVLEDGCVSGGFGSAVVEFLAGRGIPFSARLLGFPDEPVQHGGRREILEKYGLSAEAVHADMLSLAVGGGASPSEAKATPERGRLAIV
jgi:1-deoxy-D-xylulose-5-phosphate synthase